MDWERNSNSVYKTYHYVLGIGIRHLLVKTIALRKNTSIIIIWGQIITRLWDGPRRSLSSWFYRLVRAHDIKIKSIGISYSTKSSTPDVCVVVICGFTCSAALTCQTCHASYGCAYSGEIMRVLNPPPFI